MSRPVMPVLDRVSDMMSTARGRRREHAEDEIPRQPECAAVAAPSGASLLALDWLNFLMAALLMGFGPFVSLHLADRGWVPSSIGLVLTAGGLAGLLTQIPAGELIDTIKSKRVLVGIGAVAVVLGLLTLGLRPDFAPVFAAAVAQGMAGSIIGPGIAAISLGLVGHDALAGRLGRNQQFASIGGLTAAGTMGVVGYFLPSSDIFFLTAALGLPVLLALGTIRASDIHYARSCSAVDMHPTHPQRASRATLMRYHGLLTFAVCLFLFQLANASILPLTGQILAHTKGHLSSLILSGFVVVPQIIVAVLAPWVAQKAETWGRRPLLLAGLAALPIRTAFFALIADPVPLVLVQALDGLSGATLGVLTALVIADLTKGTGRFNLGQGVVGTVSGIGAALSTSVSGLIVARYGQMAGLLSVTAIGLLAVAILATFMPETRSTVARPLPAV